MFAKITVGVILASVILGGTVEAYDLPKIKPDKKISTNTKKQIFVSDWSSNKIFEENLKALVAANKNLSPASPDRVSYDKNRVFVAFYKGFAYFLDRYSIQIKDDSASSRSWTQKIFPIGQNVSPKNSQATDQKFYFDVTGAYNSLNKNSPIATIDDADDRAFIEECFKVGYYFAFGEELDDQHN